MKITNLKMQVLELPIAVPRSFSRQRLPMVRSPDPLRVRFLRVYVV